MARLRLPGRFYEGGKPFVEVLKAIKEKWPGTMFRISENLEKDPVPIEHLIFLIERDISSSKMPKDILKSLRKPMFFWVFDDLGYIKVVTTDAPKGELAVLVEEDEERGIPVGRGSF